MIVAGSAMLLVESVAVLRHERETPNEKYKTNRGASLWRCHDNRAAVAVSAQIED